MSRFESISFNDGLNKSDYTPAVKEKAKLFICENFSQYKDSIKIYLTFCFNKNIFVIKHTLEVDWKGKVYPIYLLIYIPISFPELRIYIQKVAELEINQLYKDEKIIDFSTLEIYYQKLLKYNPLQDPINFLIENIYGKFCADFPLYKAQKQISFFGPCFLNEEKTYLIDFKQEDLKLYNSIDLLRKKVKDKILDLFNSKSLEIIQASSELDVIEKDIDQELYNSYNRGKAKENIELEEIIKKLKELELKLENEIKNLKYIKGNCNKIFDTCHEIVKIRDEKKFKYTVMQKTIEEYLIYIKKGMGKKLIKFEDCINKTRSLSKELFFIMYAIEKRNNMYNK